MPIALTPNETWRYQLIDDRLPNKLPNPAGTWWKLRSLPAWVRTQIQDLISFEVKGGAQLIHSNRGQVIQLILEHGVVGVENWKDAKGADVTIRMRTENGRDVAVLDFLDRLDPAHQVELANAVEARTKVEGADKD